MGTKRAAEDAGGNTARASKSSRTEKHGDGSKKNVSKTAAHTSADFKAKALPLHLSLTHTPPAIEEREERVEGEVTEASRDRSEDLPNEDPGFIGNLTLVPNLFSTGSYGWKGNKRIAIELQLGETDSDGVKEKVQVMLTVNATVIGSKKAKGKKGKEMADSEGKDKDLLEHSEPEES